MKILYIDPISSEGHINYNRIQLQALINESICIDCVCVEGYEKYLSFPEYNKIVFSLIPLSLVNRSNSIFARLSLVRIFRYVKKNFSIRSYDIVLFSSFDEFSFYFSNIKSDNIYLVCHRNVEDLNRSIIKRRVMLLISTRISSFIVFNDYMKDRMLRAKCYNTEIVSHGFPNKITVLDASIELDIFISFLSSYEHILFSPSSGSIDYDKISELIISDDFIEFLEQNNILFVLKSSPRRFTHNSKNILIVESRLENDIYNYLFLKSIILICYPASFNYCVSGVLYECFSNSIYCLLLNSNKNFYSYKTFFAYNPFWSTVDELIVTLQTIIRKKQLNNLPYTNLDRLSKVEWMNLNK